MKKYILKGGELVSSSGLKKADVLVLDGKIAEIGEGIVDEDAIVIDCEGKYVMPGAIDVHVHFREPGHEYKEDWEHASASAVCGGVTTVCDMPNNNPPVVSLKDLEAKRGLIEGRSYVNYGIYMGFNGKNLSEINEAKNIPAVKFYACDSTGDMGVDTGVDELFEKCNKLIVTHSEDGEVIRENKMRLLDGKKEEDLYPALHSEIRSKEAAVSMTRKLCELAKEKGSRLHIAHLSVGEELEVVSQYRDLGVTCEVAPHHLLFCMADYEHLGSKIRMNPPVRESEDVFRLWKGLQLKEVDMIATDHAPHTLEEKEKPFREVPSGVPGVEMMLPIMLNAVNDEAIDFMRLAELLCERPAEVFGIKNKGKVEVDYDADLVVVDMELEKAISDDDVRSKCGWSPYSGLVFKGWPVKTFVNGELVFDGKEICGGFVGREARFSS